MRPPLSKGIPALPTNPAPATTKRRLALDPCFKGSLALTPSFSSTSKGRLKSHEELNLWKSSLTGFLMRVQAVRMVRARVRVRLRTRV